MRLIFVLFVFTVTGCAPNYYASGDGLDTKGAFHETLDFRSIDNPKLNAAIFHATNEARKANGVAPVQHSDVLQTAAQSYAERSADKRFLAHQDPTSESLKSPRQRVAAAGGENPMIAENLATTPGLKIKSGEKLYIKDQSNFEFTRQPGGEVIGRHTYASFARNVVEQWMNSPGHRKNLLSKDAVELGCGTAIYIYEGPANFVAVQNFQLFEPLK